MFLSILNLFQFVNAKTIKICDCKDSYIIQHCPYPFPPMEDNRYPYFYYLIFISEIFKTSFFFGTILYENVEMETFLSEIAGF